MVIYDKERMEVAVDLHFNEKLAEYASELSQYYKDRNPAGAEKMREKLYEEARSEIVDSYKPFFTDEMKREYVYNGGTPWLDGDYTVFGEVIDGMKVVSKIEKVKTDDEDAPKEDVRILKAVVE
jgi:cyclophilin family peptidyl-prolyl cis-trans isomerase